MEELVFAILTDDLWKIIPYREQGLIKGTGDTLARIIQHGLFRKRGELEEDPSFKQIIPYGIISNKDSYFLFKRTAGQTETRLHNKLHLGVGGHMNPGRSGVTGEGYLVDQLKRELFEEVRLENGCFIEQIKFIGFINDETIPVGRVHIGLLYDIHVSSRDVVVNETEKMTAEWITKAGLDGRYRELETWSTIAIDNYIARRDKQA